MNHINPVYWSGDCCTGFNFLSFNFLLIFAKCFMEPKPCYIQCNAQKPYKLFKEYCFACFSFKFYFWNCICNSLGICFQNMSICPKRTPLVNHSLMTDESKILPSNICLLTNNSLFLSDSMSFQPTSLTYLLFCSYYGATHNLAYKKDH